MASRTDENLSGEGEEALLYLFSVSLLDNLRGAAVLCAHYYLITRFLTNVALLYSFIVSLSMFTLLRKKGGILLAI